MAEKCHELSGPVTPNLLEIIASDFNPDFKSYNPFVW